MRLTDAVEKTIYPDGTAELTFPNGGKIRMPQVALTAFGFPEEAIIGDGGIQSAKDVDLAHKISDTKVVKGLTNEERNRIFELLTGGGEWTGKGKAQKSEAIRDLKLAIKLRSIADPREQNKFLREVTGKYGKFSNKGNPTSNTGAFKAKLESLLKQVEGYNPDNLMMVLDSATEADEKYSIEEIKGQLGMLERLRQYLTQNNVI